MYWYIDAKSVPMVREKKVSMAEDAGGNFCLREDDFASLKAWFAENMRPFPWREGRSPYAVWVAEVMLQQTQASVVVSYFERWMRRFPTVRALAAASLEEVVKAWEGLGYYSRARHLHKAARTMCKEHCGLIPSARAALEKISGLGPYTIGAILSFAFHQKAAAVDANALRVLVRYFGIEGDVTKARVQKEVWARAQELLPEREPWVVVEALIELGALVCTRVPKCAICPLFRGCLARKRGKETLLPMKKKRSSPCELKREVAVIRTEGRYLLRKVERGKVMADLYEFLYCEESESMDAFVRTLPMKCSFERKLDVQTHAFTRYRATLFPTLWRAERCTQVSGCVWVEAERMRELPFSAGHRRILLSLEG